MSDLFNLYIINRNHTVIVLSLPPFATLTLVSPSLITKRIHSRRLTNFHDLASALPRSFSIDFYVRTSSFRFSHCGRALSSYRCYRPGRSRRIFITRRGRENLSSLGQSVYKDIFYRPPSTNPRFISYLPVNPSLIV